MTDHAANAQLPQNVEIHASRRHALLFTQVGVGAQKNVTWLNEML